MKKLAILVLGVLSLGAYATMENMPGMPEILIEYQEIPRAGATALSLTDIIVYQTGEVMKSTCSNRDCEDQKIDQLSPKKVARIENLIESARDGEVVTETHQIHCMAMAQYSYKYSADNGSVTLLEGALCQDPTVNQSSAATKLISLLDAYRNRNANQ